MVAKQAILKAIFCRNKNCPETVILTFVKIWRNKRRECESVTVGHHCLHTSVIWENRENWEEMLNWFRSDRRRGARLQNKVAFASQTDWMNIFCCKLGHLLLSPVSSASPLQCLETVSGSVKSLIVNCSPASSHQASLWEQWKQCQQAPATFSYFAFDRSSRPAK